MKLNAVPIYNALFGDSKNPVPSKIWVDFFNSLRNAILTPSTESTTTVTTITQPAVNKGTLFASDLTGTIHLDFSAANGFYTALTGTNRIVTFSNQIEDGVYRLLVVAGSGSIVSWPPIVWLGGGTPPGFTGGSSADAITFWYVDNTMYGSLTLA